MFVDNNCMLLEIKVIMKNYPGIYSDSIYSISMYNTVTLL